MRPALGKQCTNLPLKRHVRFGSKADICSAKRHVRFAPESGHVRCKEGYPLSANSGHQLAGVFDHLVRD